MNRKKEAKKLNNKLYWLIYEVVMNDFKWKITIWISNWINSLFFIKWNEKSNFYSGNKNDENYFFDAFGTLISCNFMSFSNDYYYYLI